MYKDILQEIVARKKFADETAAKHLYDNLITLLTHGRSNKMSPVVKSVLKRKPNRILDIGCGYGALALFFAMQGIETVGIDLQQDGLDAGGRLASELGIANVTLSRMDACAISLSDFDLALSTDFYEHLPYPSQPVHLQSVYQALKPGGVYIIRAPHRSNIRQHREDHIGLPSFGRLQQQAAEAGFTARFSVAHTAVISSINYHIPLERWIESRSWSDLAIYKGLQKFGLANVIAELRKNM